MNLMNDLKKTKMYNHYQVITLDGDTYNQCYATKRAIVFLKELIKGNHTADYKLECVLKYLNKNYYHFHNFKFIKTVCLDFLRTNYTILIDYSGYKVDSNLLLSALQLLKIKSRDYVGAAMLPDDYLMLKNIENEYILLKVKKINENDNINRFDQFKLINY